MGDVDGVGGGVPGGEVIGSVGLRRLDGRVDDAQIDRDAQLTVREGLGVQDAGVQELVGDVSGVGESGLVAVGPDDDCAGVAQLLGVGGQPLVAVALVGSEGAETAISPAAVRVSRSPSPSQTWMVRPAAMASARPGVPNSGTPPGGFPLG